MNYHDFCAQCGGELTAGPHANDYTCEACGKAVDAFAADAESGNDVELFYASDECAWCGHYSGYGNSWCGQCDGGM